MRLAEAAGLKPVPTGIDHGTITVVSEGKPHEVTTFREDVDTFGRHAEVAFGADLEADARRRDFTMNALYAAPDGTVIDPLGGMDDLRRGASGSSAMPGAHPPRIICASCGSSGFTRIMATRRPGWTRRRWRPVPPISTGWTGCRANGSGPRCASFSRPPIPPPPSRRCRRRVC